MQEANSKDGSALLFVRGSTNTIGSLLHKKTMPSDYAQVGRSALYTVQHDS